MDIVWEAELDEKYKCKVYRMGTYNGALIITDMLGKILLQKPVTMTFGARFGPDVDDVETWQEMCVDFADSQGTNE